MNVIEQRRAFYTEGKPTERRLTPFEVRSFVDPTGDGGATERIGLTGYASTVETWYSVRDWLGEYDEMICAGAFNKALQENDDVRLLVNHEGIPVARTKSGTMTLREDATGLLVDVPELDTASPLVQTLRSAMGRGDVDQMSFAFRATRQEWNDDYSKRWVREVQLFDTSVVTYPANDGTNVKLRGGLALATLDRLAKGLALTEDDEAVLRAMLAPEPAVAPEAVATFDARARRQAQLRAIAGAL